MFEREWAAEARLGWFGKNTNCSIASMARIFFSRRFSPTPSSSRRAAPIASIAAPARRCLDLCPTGALADGYLMEPRLCISYLTIENRGAIPLELRSKLGNWIFGCDICQEVCPWNVPFTEARATTLMPFMPDLMRSTMTAFSRRFSKSAVKRAKRRGLLRNVAVALGNSGNRDAVPSSRARWRRERAAGAIACGVGARRTRRRERARRARAPPRTEIDPDVSVEIEAALTAPGEAPAGR